MLLEGLLVGHDASLLGVGEEELARFETAAFLDLGGVEVERAGLARHHESIVGGDIVSAGSEPVAVEHRADALAVGGCDERGAVPRLRERGVVVVERPALVAHLVFLAAERLGDQEAERVGQVATTVEEEFERVVDARGVGLLRVGDHGSYRVDVELVGLDIVLARPHPVDVALDGVDLAVVDHVSVGVGEMPRAERVGRKAGVDQHERRVHPRVGEVGVVLGDLVALQETLVDQRFSVERADVEALVAVGVALADRLLDRSPSDVEPMVELVRS